MYTLCNLSTYVHVNEYVYVFVCVTMYVDIHKQTQIYVIQ